MPSLDLWDLMKLYARRGIADWRDAAITSGGLRKRAQDCLGTAIADNETEAFTTMTTLYNQANINRLRFIPMPKHPKRGIERCFFLPIREIKSGGQEIVTFDLFLLVQQRDCLAFRFEPAHPLPSAHNYGHVQMNQQMIRKTIQTAVPSWLPIKYPAFPIATSNPLRVFLAMVIAVHGYSTGLVTVLQDVFQKANRVREATLYLDELEKMLD